MGAYGLVSVRGPWSARAAVVRLRANRVTCAIGTSAVLWGGVAGGADPRPATGPAAVPWGQLERSPPAGSPDGSQTDTGIRVFLTAPSRAPVALFRVTLRSGIRNREGPVAPQRDAPVCRAPCGEILHAGAASEYFVGGRGLSRSPSFSLHGAPSELTLAVRPGRRAVFVGGWVLAVLGAAGGLGGAATMTFADDDRSQLRAGGIALAIGLPLVVAGSLMIWAGRTRVTFTRGRPHPVRAH